MAMLCSKVIVLALCLVVEVNCQTSLSQSDKDELLNAHNNLRGQVSPAASNMETMVRNIYYRLWLDSYHMKKGYGFPVMQYVHP